MGSQAGPAAGADLSEWLWEADPTDGEAAAYLGPSPSPPILASSLSNLYEEPWARAVHPSSKPQAGPSATAPLHWRSRLGVGRATVPRGGPRAAVAALVAAAARADAGLPVSGAFYREDSVWGLPEGAASSPQPDSVTEKASLINLLASSVGAVRLTDRVLPSCGEAPAARQPGAEEAAAADSTGSTQEGAAGRVQADSTAVELQPLEPDAGKERELFSEAGEPGPVEKEQLHPSAKPYGPGEDQLSDNQQQQLGRAGMEHRPHEGAEGSNAGLPGLLGAPSSGGSSTAQRAATAGIEGTIGPLQAPQGAHPSGSVGTSTGSAEAESGATASVTATEEVPLGADPEVADELAAEEASLDAQPGVVPGGALQVEDPEVWGGTSGTGTRCPTDAGSALGPDVPSSPSGSACPDACLRGPQLLVTGTAAMALPPGAAPAAEACGGAAAPLMRADAAVQTEAAGAEPQTSLEWRTGGHAPSPSPRLSLFEVLRMLPPGVVTRNLMRRLGMREWCALRLLAREWDQQMRTEWADCTTRVLRPDCVADLKRRHSEGPAQSLARRHPAASRLTLLHRRLERLVLPNTSAVGSSGLLEVPVDGAWRVAVSVHTEHRVKPLAAPSAPPTRQMPPVVVDDSPPLSDALQWALEGFAPRLRALRLESDAVAVSELDLELLSHHAPGLTELSLRFDVCERPAPALEALAGLAGLRRLGVALGNQRLNYDPVPERMVRSLSALPRLSALSLELTTTELPLPTASPALQGLTSLRLAVIFRGYSAGQQSAQLRGLVSQLAELTRLRALAVPDGYRGSDGDLLRAAAPVLPSLTALHLPRLSATRPELEALARLPLLQHVTLGSIDVAPDEDYQDLIPYDYANNRYGAVDSSYGGGTHTGFNATGSSLLSPTAASRLAAGAGRAEGSLGDAVGDSDGTAGWGDEGGCGSLRDGGLSGGSWKDEEGISPRGPLLHRTPNSNGGFGRLSGCGPLGRAGLGADNGRGGGDGGYSGPGLGVLAGMGSWRHLALCGEQRMEALVAAGPLPPGLRGLSVQVLRWPRGTRADLLPVRAVATLGALCADLARPPALLVRLSLEAFSGTATAVFAPEDPPDVEPQIGGTDSTADLLANSPAGAAASPAGPGFRVSGSVAKRVGALGCTTVREVVATACEALGSVPGLAGLRWSGLLPLLAHLGPCSMAATLRRLRQVSELEVAGGLAGCHPAASPLFLVHFARALGAMRGLRVLRLGPAAAHSDALVQGTPGLLLALRPPLCVEASFLGPKDAAELRAMLEGLGAHGRGQAGGTSLSRSADRTLGIGGQAMTELEYPRVTVVSADAGAGVGGDSGSGGRSGGSEEWGGSRGGAGESSGGWAAGDGLWWVDEDVSEEWRPSGWGPKWNR